MFQEHNVTLDWGGRDLSLSTGKIARQAHGSVVVRYGQSEVLVTVVAASEASAEQDFFPLTVHYQEKTFAAGRIPGGFLKREGRPSEHETLTSRLIDRPVRPLFAAGFKCDTQIIATVLSHDLENAPDIAAMVGASAALALSGLPFAGPICGARIGYAGGEYILNPTLAQQKDSTLDLVVAGTSRGVLMVESEAGELAEDVMLGAVMFGHKACLPVIEAINDLAGKAGVVKRPFTAQGNEDLVASINSSAGAALQSAYEITAKTERRARIDEIRAGVQAQFAGPEGAHTGVAVGEAFKKIEADIVRSRILDKGQRIDGRDLASVREIASEVGNLPRAHGSALFTRGETQALVVTTLGTNEDEQFVDALEGTYKSAFMLHYNFPPYSVGETGRLGTPGRREIGHGKLAWRAIRPMLPGPQDFPYTIRIVSEITESNGSSSMATVCGASLSLMDAGVSIKAPVAGIAMGLIKEGDRFAVLSDILGDEDHLGDMDFKVAGSAEGITSLQMDIKIDGITEEIMKSALAQARDGRLHILDEMAKAIEHSRSELGEHAPRIEVMSIPVDKIRDVIGTGGKVIREIVEKTGAKINVEDDGTVKIASSEAKAIEDAAKWIKSITAEPEIGAIYKGKVVKCVDFGAFVNFFGPRDGLVHISQIAPRKIGRVTDVISEGDMVFVKLIGMDDRGKVRLSMKVVDQETGEEIGGR